MSSMPGLTVIMQHLRVTSAELARRVDVDPSAVCHWRRAGGGARVGTIRLLCDHLCCTPDDLLGYRTLTGERLENIQALYDQREHRIPSETRRIPGILQIVRAVVAHER